MDLTFVAFGEYENVAVKIHKSRYLDCCNVIHVGNSTTKSCANELLYSGKFLLFENFLFFENVRSLKHLKYFQHVVSN